MYYSVESTGQNLGGTERERVCVCVCRMLDEAARKVCKLCQHSKASGKLEGPSTRVLRCIDSRSISIFRILNDKSLHELDNSHRARTPSAWSPNRLRATVALSPDATDHLCERSQYCQ